MSKTITISDDAWKALNRMKTDFRDHSSEAKSFSSVITELEAIYDGAKDEYWS